MTEPPSEASTVSKPLVEPPEASSTLQRVSVALEEKQKLSQQLSERLEPTNFKAREDAEVLHREVVKIVREFTEIDERLTKTTSDAKDAVGDDPELSKTLQPTLDATKHGWQRANALLDKFQAIVHSEVEQRELDRGLLNTLGLFASEAASLLEELKISLEHESGLAEVRDTATNEWKKRALTAEESSARTHVRLDKLESSLAATRRDAKDMETKLQQKTTAYVKERGRVLDMLQVNQAQNKLIKAYQKFLVTLGLDDITEAYKDCGLVVPDESESDRQLRAERMARRHHGCPIELYKTSELEPFYGSKVAHLSGAVLDDPKVPGDAKAAIDSTAKVISKHLLDGPRPFVPCLVRAESSLPTSISSENKSTQAIKGKSTASSPQGKPAKKRLESKLSDSDDELGDLEEADVRKAIKLSRQSLLAETSPTGKKPRRSSRKNVSTLASDASSKATPEPAVINIDDLCSDDDDEGGSQLQSPVHGKRKASSSNSASLSKRPRGAAQTGKASTGHKSHLSFKDATKLETVFGGILRDYWSDNVPRAFVDLITHVHGDFAPNNRKGTKFKVEYVHRTAFMALLGFSGDDYKPSSHSEVVAEIRDVLPDPVTFDIASFRMSKDLEIKKFLQHFDDIRSDQSLLAAWEATHYVPFNVAQKKHLGRHAEYFLGYVTARNNRYDHLRYAWKAYSAYAAMLVSRDLLPPHVIVDPCLPIFLGQKEHWFPAGKTLREMRAELLKLNNREPKRLWYSKTPEKHPFNTANKSGLATAHGSDVGSESDAFSDSDGEASANSDGDESDGLGGKMASKKQRKNKAMAGKRKNLKVSSGEESGDE